MGEISVKPKEYPCPIKIAGQSICTFIRGIPLAENFPRDAFIGGRAFVMPDGSVSRFLKQMERLELGRGRENRWLFGDSVLEIIQASLRPHPSHPHHPLEIRTKGLGIETYLPPSLINFLSPSFPPNPLFR